MSTLGEVIAGIHAALRESDQARHALQQAGNLLDKATQDFLGILRGANDPAAQQVSTSLTLARARIDDTYRALTAAEHHARTI